MTSFVVSVCGPGKSCLGKCRRHQVLSLRSFSSLMEGRSWVHCLQFSPSHEENDNHMVFVRAKLNDCCCQSLSDRIMTVGQQLKVVNGDRRATEHDNNSDCMRAQVLPALCGFKLCFIHSCRLEHTVVYWCCIRGKMFCLGSFHNKGKPVTYSLKTFNSLHDVYSVKAGVYLFQL